MLLAICLFLVTSAAAHGQNCCLKVTGSCRSACEKLHYDTISDLETKQQRLLDVHNFCPQHLVPFWKCMNQTGDDYDDYRSWAVCCEEAQTEKCRRGCNNVMKSSELPLYCRKSDEIALYSCVEKQESGDECCVLARSPTCHEACKGWIQEPGKVSWSSITSLCTASVQHCLSDMSKPVVMSTPQKYLHCCEHATTSVCKEACRRNLKRRAYDIEIMSSLNDACGPLVLHEGEIKLAQCLLMSEPAAIKKLELGIDGGILHCCYKAVSEDCKKNCVKTFFNDGQNNREFERYCHNSTEENLLQCYDEASEPCEIGCSGLKYCSEFNNRPTDLFRSCNEHADNAAKHDIEDLQPKGFIKLPNKKKLYINNLNHCEYEKFKALACINQIKPCHRFSQTTKVCYEDCMELMEECVDFKKSQALESAAIICKFLAPPNAGSNCIKLDIFDVRPTPETTEELTTPCRGAPCVRNEVCKINRSCNSPEECRMHTCMRGCVVSHNLIVPEKTYARAPKPSSKGRDICHNICLCGRYGKESTFKHCKEDCKPHGPRCKGVENGSTLYMGCNLCSCNYGEFVCSKKLCNMTYINITNTTAVSATTLPCKCNPNFVPVCSRNGQTSPNECLASCMGSTNFTFGPCSDINPCKNVRCQKNDEVCLPRRQVCLSLLHPNCPQHVCVSTKNCNYDPVCDTDGVTHSCPSRLLRAKKELAYFGPCLANCQNEGIVCGVDGNNYKSECAAHARYIQVDYPGNCTSLGSVHQEPQVECSDVECEPLPATNCLAHTPPGACCPVCAGAFTALFSQKDVDRVLMSYDGQIMDQLTVEALMSTLEREVKTAECSLRGHLTIESDLLVLIVPTKKNSTDLIREACIREAEKLTVLIQRLSPRIVVPLSTSILTTSRLVHQHVEGSSDPGSSSDLFSIPILVALLTIINLLGYYFRL